MRPRTTARTAIETGSISAASAGILVADREDLRGRQQQLVLERTVLVHSDERDLDAGVRPADPAGVAAPTAGDGPQRDARTGRERLRGSRRRPRGSSGRFVPLDAGVQRRRVVDRADVAGEVVEVGAAEADRFGPDEHLTGTGRARLGRCDDLHHTLRLSDSGAHRPHGVIESPPTAVAQQQEAEMREPVFTETMQISIVVRDLDATMKTYVEEYGIGPWEVYEFNPGTMTTMDGENGEPTGSPSRSP